MLNSTIDDKQLQRIKAYPGVASAVGVLIQTTKLDRDHPLFLQIGIPPRDLTPFGVSVVSGKPFTATATDQIMLGWRIADDLHKHVGDSFVLDSKRYTVVGIFRTGQVFGDEAAMLPLITLQALAREPDTTTLVFVRVKPGTPIQPLRARIAHDNPSLATIRFATEFGQVDRNLDFLTAAAKGATVLAWFVGVIIVANTMLLSFVQRTREFGLLRAIGWARWRVIVLVIGEALVISIAGAALGIGLSFAAVAVLQQLSALAGLLHPTYTAQVFLPRVLHRDRYRCAGRAVSRAPRRRAATARRAQAGVVGMIEATGAGEQAVVVTDVVKTFDRSHVRALDGISLSIHRNEFIAITGPSGSGKSTLLNLLAALDRPDAGQICVDGIDLTRKRHLARYRRDEVGLVFQLHNLLPHLDVRRNVEIAMFGGRLDRKERRARADELLASVDLAGKEHRRPPELSGGERRARRDCPGPRERAGVAARRRTDGQSRPGLDRTGARTAPPAPRSELVDDRDGHPRRSRRGNGRPHRDDRGGEAQVGRRHRRRSNAGVINRSQAMSMRVRPCRDRERRHSPETYLKLVHDSGLSRAEYEALLIDATNATRRRVAARVAPSEAALGCARFAGDGDPNDRFTALRVAGLVGLDDHFRGLEGNPHRRARFEREVGAGRSRDLDGKRDGFADRARGRVRLRRQCPRSSSPRRSARFHWAACCAA